MPNPYAFRIRAREISRVEGFSDVVFGFALTLIVVSLEVPNTYEELMHAMRGLPAFAICFATLVWIWSEHHKFFQRYDLKDPVVIVLNAILLFVVLFYTYPLKFLFAIATGAIRGGRGDGRTLFLIYGLGFIGIFSMLFFLYYHALRKREDLDLNELEVHDTVTSLQMYAGYVIVGIASIVMAQLIPARQIGLAGWCYFLLGPISAFIGYRRGSQRGELQSRHVQAAQTTANRSDSAAVHTVAANGP